MTKVAVIEEMWSNKTFKGLEDFRAVMGRDMFRSIRSELRFYPTYDHDVDLKDPLWHSRIILQHF